MSALPRIHVLLATLALAVAVTSGAEPPEGDAGRGPLGLAPRDILWESKQAAFERLMELEARPFEAARTLQEDYDALFYDLDIEFFTTSKTVAGTVVMRAASLVDAFSTQGHPEVGITIDVHRSGIESIQGELQHGPLSVGLHHGHLKRFATDISPFALGRRGQQPQQQPQEAGQTDGVS